MLKAVRTEKRFNAGVSALRNVEYTPEDAVYTMFSDISLHSDGQLERLQEQLTNTNKFVAFLVQTLVEAGSLKAGHLQALLDFDGSNGPKSFHVEEGQANG